MASNEELIVSKYGDGAREENRSSGKRGDYMMEFRNTRRILDRHVTPDSEVVELGCGTGYYGMYLADWCRSYTGIDLSPGNIAVFQKKIQESGKTNLKAQVGDATDLRGIDSGSADAVLVFGPMYHLPPAERERVFAESFRICRDGGLILFAYINKAGVYLQDCFEQPDRFPRHESTRKMLGDGIHEDWAGLYWFTMPEEMEDTASGFGLEVLENLGVDFVFSPLFTEPPEGREHDWASVTDFMSRHASCTGVSNHAVLVCRKPAAP